MYKTETDTLSVIIKSDTGKAIFCELLYSHNLVWFPKSRIKIIIPFSLSKRSEIEVEHWLITAMLKEKKLVPYDIEPEPINPFEHEILQIEQTIVVLNEKQVPIYTLKSKSLKDRVIGFFLEKKKLFHKKKKSGNK